MYFIDTESIGYFGPTIMFQYCKDDGPAVIHNIWDNTVQSTLDLVEMQLQDTLVGFNLVHDWFHYTRTYNILSRLPKRLKPDPLDYHDVERDESRYCLRPKVACDLMLIGRRDKFQAAMNQKAINIRKVPRILSELMLKELKENVEIPSIYFSNSKKGYEWRSVPLIKGTTKEATELEDEIDPDFVNIQLKFAPNNSLKSIMAYIGHEVTTLDDLDEHLPKYKGHSYFPAKGDWLDVFDTHIFSWRNDPRKVKYALNDPIYTRELWHYLDRPRGGDIDSELAIAVGGMHWQGFTINEEGCRERLKTQEAVFNTAPVNVSSPTQVKAWLSQVADPLEQQVLVDTSADTLKKIVDDWSEDNPSLAKRCGVVLDARKSKMEINLLSKLLEAGKMYCSNKIIGTKSNRMSGGSESYLSSKGSLNPQGIPKKGAIRKLLTLGSLEMPLCGGDFSGFEVSIADAVYDDPLLRSELLSGKKMHALFGAVMYNMSYEDIMATEELEKNHPRGFYNRAKTGFFASLYGAEEDKLAESMWLTKEEAKIGLENFFNKYKVIKAKRLKLLEMFTALIQPGEIGSKIIWKEPAKYIESMLGFRRHFDLEFKIIRCLFDMAQNPSEEFKELGRSIKVVRRDRTQTASGATQSALYAAAFGMQSHIARAAANHQMQSVGGELTKELQAKIWSVQPVGVNAWYVMPLNIHDEIECPTRSEVVEKVHRIVDETVESFKSKVPLVKMEWKTDLNNWGEK